MASAVAPAPSGPTRLESVLASVDRYGLPTVFAVVLLGFVLWTTMQAQTGILGRLDALASVTNQASVNQAKIADSLSKLEAEESALRMAVLTAPGVVCQK